LLWDSLRTQQPGFWLQSSLSYGPVDFGYTQFPDRLLAFGSLLALMTDSLWLNGLAVVGGVGLLLGGWFSRGAARWGWAADWLLLGFGAGFVAFHALFSFQIWDRYLLGLTPLMALLLARIIQRALHLGAMFIKSGPVLKRLNLPDSGLWWGRQLVAVLLIIALLAPATGRTLRGGYALGGGGEAYAGAEAVTAYLRYHAGANVTLYHRWLGAHWRFYLFDFPYDVRYWEDETQLARFALANASGEQYLAFPPWQSLTPARLALQDVGLGLALRFQSHRSDGEPGLSLYQLVPLDTKPAKLER
jgi:hypothetical protein